MISYSRAVMVSGLGALAAVSLAGPAAWAKSTPVVGAPTTATVQPAKIVPDANKIICKSQPDTGSRLGGKRICMTRADWTKKDWADHNALDDMAASKTMGH